MNMNKKLVGCVLVGAAVIAPIGAAENKGDGVANAAAPAKAEQRISQYVNGNLFGIQNIKKDAKGRIVSLVSIGRAPISSSLTKARAKNQAFKKADAQARAEFIKWLTTVVVYTRIDQDEVAITQRGESKGDAGQGSASVTGETTELTQEQVVSVAAGFVKGMVQIGAGLNGDGEAVVILGWSAATADQTDVVRDQNVPRAPVSADGATGATEGGATETPSRMMSVSESAGEFL